MVAVVILGSRQIRYRAGCCGSRSMEEVVLGYVANLYRRFGQKNLRCSYVDVSDPEARGYPGVIRAFEQGDIELPAVLVNGSLISHGKTALYELPEIIERAATPGDRSRFPARAGT